MPNTRTARHEEFLAGAVMRALAENGHLPTPREVMAGGYSPSTVPQTRRIVKERVDNILLEIYLLLSLKAKEATTPEQRHRYINLNLEISDISAYKKELFSRRGGGR